MSKLIDYLKTRLNQRSFWIGEGVACSAAAVLPHPWNFVSFGVGTMASLVKDGNILKGNDDGSAN